MKNIRTIRKAASLEALEARIVPATFHWNVDAGGNWNDPNNWFNETTGMVDGFPNGPSDVAKFEDVITANRTVIIPEAVKLSIGTILFDDDNTYTIAPENAVADLRLNSSASVISITNNGTGAAVFTVPLILQKSAHVDGTGALRIAAPISEGLTSSELTKDGTGTLTFGDGTAAYSNTYTGTTFVTEGTLELDVDGMAIPAKLIVGNSVNAARVELLRSEQIADSVQVEVYSRGALDLNANGESLGQIFLQTGDVSGAVIAGTGTLTALSNINALNPAGTGAMGALIAANINLPDGSHNFGANPGAAEADLEITGAISGAGSITAVGAGTIRLAGTTANTWTGGMSVNPDSTVVLAKPDGVAAIRTASVSGTLVLGASEQVSAFVTVHATGTFDLAGHDETLSSLTLFSGPTGGGVVNTGTGMLTLENTGSDATVNLSITSGGGVGAVINGNLAFEGTSVRLSVNDGAAADDLIINASISGAAAVSKDTAGNLRLNGANTFTGALGVFLGTVTTGHENALGAAGLASLTQMSSGTSLVVAPGTTLGGESIRLFGTGVGGMGAFVGGMNASTTAKLRVGSSELPTIATQSGFVFNGELGALDDSTSTLTVDASAAPLTFGADAIFSAQINGFIPGSLHDQVKVLGNVDLTGAALNVGIGIAAVGNSKFTILSNDGTDAITGTFDGLPEGATFQAGGRRFSISYVGGDGNDVMVTALPFERDLAISTDGKSATYTDVDGDLVTVKISKGTLTTGDFAFGSVADNRQFLNRLTLDAAETGANVTITAKRTANGGNGLVNIEHLDATGVDLGVVKIGGDLGHIYAGTPGGDPKVPGIKSLEAHSISVLGTSASTAYISTIEGALPKLVTKTDLRGAVSAVGADGKIGSVIIGGSFRASATGVPLVLGGEAGIGSVKVAGDIVAGLASLTIRSSAGAIGSISVGGNLDAVGIEAFGAATAPAKGVDLALGKLTVKGSVAGTTIRAGGVGSGNADASIGSIAVGGDWRSSTVMAGANEGMDTFAGTADDAKLSGAGVRDNPAIFSSIGSLTVAGQAIGSSFSTTDMYGVVAEKIGKAQVGTRTFAFTNGATPEAFFAAPTADGEGAENPAFDFTIRELGSATPAPVLGGVNLDISSDGKSATYTDADGDLVTVKRSAGAFAMGDFTIAANASGGGDLQTLTVTPAANDALVNLSITAKPGANGGNGFVNVGRIAATGTVLGSVIVGGDLLEIDGGLSVNGKPGIAALSVHSMGHTANGILTSTIADGLGKLAVKTDIRFTTLDATAAGGRIGSIAIGGSSAGANTFKAADGIGSIKSGGSFAANVEVTNGALGSLTVGGDLSGSTIRAFGQLTQPAKGPDIAIKSITVKGTLQNSTIEAGGLTNNGNQTANADASIGSVSVGRDWIRSNMSAGASTGTDGFLGTADDTKVLGNLGLRDRVEAFSTIASIIIKGQALGSNATGDARGIVAEQIGKASVGNVKFKFDKGPRDAADAFALAPTGPGVTGLSSDFYLREIVA